MNVRNHNSLNQPLVSVFMAVYNNAGYLRQSIDSILQQTYSNFELIIVNDGSSDDSHKIISTYTDPRIMYIRNEENRGIIASRNIGLKSANGKYLAVLDSDDIAVAERLEKQVAFMEANPDYGLCGTNFTNIDATGKKLSKTRFPQKDPDIRAYLYLGNCFCHSSTMVRTELAKKFCYSGDIILGEDYQLFIDIAGVSKLANLPFMGCYYRLHSNNVSTQMNSQMYSSIRRINRQNLIKLGISFTEKQLDIHSQFLIFNSEYFDNEEQFNELENWVKKLVYATQNDARMNRPVIFKFLLHRWFVICYKRNKKRKLFFTPFLLRYHFRYVNLMIEEAFAHSTNTYRKKIGLEILVSV